MFALGEDEALKNVNCIEENFLDEIKSKIQNLLWMPRLFWHSIKVIIIGFKLDSIDFCHGRRWNVLPVSPIKVTVERGFIEITVFSFIHHRLSVVEWTSNTSMIAVLVELEATFTILWHEFNTLLMNIVMTVIALHALLEEAAEKLLTVLTNGRSRVRVNLECVRNFHSRNCPAAVAVWSTTARTSVWYLLKTRNKRLSEVSFTWNLSLGIGSVISISSCTCFQWN